MSRWKSYNFVRKTPADLEEKLAKWQKKYLDLKLQIVIANDPAEKENLRKKRRCAVSMINFYKYSIKKMNGELK